MKSFIGRRTAFAVISASLLSGCASNWSQSDKAKLGAVAISSVSVAKDAYQKPDATDSPGMGQSIPVLTGGGLIPALIGSAIDATVTAKQQHKFEETNLQYFEALQKCMVTPPTAKVGAALKKALGGHEFFGSRIVEKSATAFTTEIIHFGLQKSPISKGTDVLLRVRIIAKITLKMPDGSHLIDCQVTGVASTAKRAPEILANPDFFDTSFTEASDDLAEQLTYKLVPKLRS